MHPFKGLKGGRGSGLTSACRNSFDSDDPELEEIEFNKRDPGPGFQSFSEDIDLNLDEVEPIYSEPEFKNEQREFDFHIYDLLSVRGGSYRCLQTGKEGINSQQQCSEMRRQGANDESSSEQGKQYHQAGERLWGGGGGGGQKSQKSQHWSQLGLLSDPKVTQWSQFGAGGQLSSDSDYASYDASVPTPANGRGEASSDYV